VIASFVLSASAGLTLVAFIASPVGIAAIASIAVISGMAVIEVRQVARRRNYYYRFQIGDIRDAAMRRMFVEMMDSNREMLRGLTGRGEGGGR
jgi:hypothetical protein